jgi:molybdate transport system substrate-binding protein
MRFLFALLLAASVHAAEVRVFAAASLADVMQEIAAAYEKQGGHDHIVFNFAGSSTLARQIEDGAPADLFFSADELKMDALQKMDLIVKETRVSFISNSLVIAGTIIRRPSELIGKKIAMGEPSTVPVGIYTRQWLTSIGLWKQVEPNVIPTENVRAALAAVRAGNADVAIVYRTDVQPDAKHYMISEGPRISYPFAMTKNAEQPDAARKFLAYVKSPAAMRIFQKYRFIIHPFQVQ